MSHKLSHLWLKYPGWFNSLSVLSLIPIFKTPFSLIKIWLFAREILISALADSNPFRNRFDTNHESWGKQKVIPASRCHVILCSKPLYSSGLKRQFSSQPARSASLFSLCPFLTLDRRHSMKLSSNILVTRMALGHVCFDTRTYHSPLICEPCLGN